MLIDNLPPDSAVMRRAHLLADQPRDDGDRQRRQQLAPVRSLEGIPVVSTRDAMQLVNASPDEFSRQHGNDQQAS